MKTRLTFLTFLLLLSLVATTSVMAKGGTRLPAWEVSFDPSQYMEGATGAYNSVVFHNHLFINFGLGTEDQVWGTSNGKDWSFAWKPDEIQPGLNGIDFMTVFKDQWYVIVYDFNRQQPGQLMRSRDGQNWELVATADDVAGSRFCAMSSFKGALYMGHCDTYSDTNEYAAHLWRSSSGDPGTWQEVAQFPGWDGIGAYGSFNGALYVGSPFVNDGSAPAQIWRSYNGVSWDSVTMDGFGNPTNLFVSGFGQKDGYFYAGMGSFEGGDIWRSRDGMRWKPVSTDGLGNPNNLAFGFVTYTGLLYTYALNFEQGCSVFSSKDGIHWTSANEPGWGDPRNVGVDGNFGWSIFKGRLYLASFDVMKLAKP